MKNCENKIRHGKDYTTSTEIIERIRDSQLSMKNCENKIRHGKDYTTSTEIIERFLCSDTCEQQVPSITTFALSTSAIS